MIEQVVRFGFGSKYLDLLSHPAGPSQGVDKLPHESCVLYIPATLKAETNVNCEHYRG